MKKKIIKYLYVLMKREKNKVKNIGTQEQMI